MDVTEHAVFRTMFWVTKCGLWGSVWGVFWFPKMDQNGVRKDMKNEVQNKWIWAGEGGGPTAGELGGEPLRVW